MAATTRYGIRHPLKSDEFAPHTDMTNLAGDVETALLGVEALGLPSAPWAGTSPDLRWDSGTSTGIVLDEATSWCRWRSHHIIAQVTLSARFTTALPTGTGYGRFRVVPSGGLTWNGFIIASAYRLTAAGVMTAVAVAPTADTAAVNGFAIANVPWVAGDTLMLSAEFEPAAAAITATAVAEEVLMDEEAGEPETPEPEEETTEAAGE